MDEKDTAEAGFAISLDLSELGFHWHLGWIAEDREEVGEAGFDRIAFLHLKGFRVLQINHCCRSCLDRAFSSWAGLAKGDGVEVAGDDRRKGRPYSGGVALPRPIGVVHILHMRDHDDVRLEGRGGEERENFLDRVLRLAVPLAGVFCRGVK